MSPGRKTKVSCGCPETQEKLVFGYPVLRFIPQRWIPELRFGYPPLRKFSKSFWEKLGLFLESLGWSQRQLCIKTWPLSLASQNMFKRILRRQEKTHTHTHTHTRFTQNDPLCACSSLSEAAGRKKEKSIHQCAGKKKVYTTVETSFLVSVRGPLCCIPFPDLWYIIYPFRTYDVYFLLSFFQAKKWYTPSRTLAP